MLESVNILPDLSLDKESIVRNYNTCQLKTEVNEIIDKIVEEFSENQKDLKEEIAKKIISKLKEAEAIDYLQVREIIDPYKNQYGFEITPKASMAAFVVPSLSIHETAAKEIHDIALVTWNRIEKEQNHDV